MEQHFMTTETDTDQQEAMGDDWAAAMAEQTSAAQPGQEEAADQKGGGDYEKAEFGNLDGQPASEAPASDGEEREVEMDIILDVPVVVSMEIGRTRLPIRNLLRLNQGSVVELDRLAGEPLDVLVTGTLIAHGEVVVVNEKYGIRLTDVISPAERVRKLR
jgi:flagellar motor switch protein FliN/FliY